MSQSSFTGTVVVTGASAGLGRAIVRAFARPGVRLGLLARGQQGLDATRREAETLGAEALAVPTDVAYPAQVEAAAAALEARFGPPDVWVNNAMTSVFSPVKELLPEEIHRVTEVTYLGQVYGTMAALRRMLPRDQGVIICVGSALAYRGIPLQAAYCASKHAINGFTESLRSELLHDKSRVRVTVVQMPAMNTPQFGWVKNKMAFKPQPVPPIFQPEVAARAVLYAATHKRREVYVGASTVEAIEGNKLAPGLLDHYLARTGYKSQLTPVPEDPNRPDNLWAPVGGDHGAHGRFDTRSADHSQELWLATHRPVGKQWLLAGAAALGAAALVAVARKAA